MSRVTNSSSARRTVMFFGKLSRSAAYTAPICSVIPATNGMCPVVYVCRAGDESEARQIHKRVWNQGIAPFLVVVSPRVVRLYSGFNYEKPRNNAQPGLIQELTDLHNIESALSALRPQSIDSGLVWGQWGKYVSPEHRVDRRLLDNLLKLDLWL